MLFSSISLNNIVIKILEKLLEWHIKKVLLLYYRRRRQQEEENHNSSSRSSKKRKRKRNFGDQNNYNRNKVKNCKSYHKSGSSGNGGNVINSNDDIMGGKGSKMMMITCERMDRSVDSIGSCSLDADADSTDFSDTSGIITPSCAKDLTREFTSRIRERCQVSPIKCQQTAAFLDSETGKISTTIINKQRSSLDKNINCSNNIIINNLNNNNNSRNITPIITTEAGDPIGGISPTTIVTSVAINQHKKPSYLNLACCVNGYSNFTTYDSAFRQNISKSREVSPIRPIGRNSNTTVNSTTAYVKSPGNYLTPPEITLSYSTSSSGRSPETRKITENMTTVADNTSISIMDDERNGGQRLTEKNINDDKNDVKTTSPGDSMKVGKSFIQQRVERLYGSGAQNLYSPKRVIQRNNTSENNESLNIKSPNNKIAGITSPNGGGGGSGYGLNSSSSDLGENNNGMSEEDLPVLRHLRPEFRAQLPLISPKKSYSKMRFDISDVKNDSPSSNRNLIDIGGGTANSHYTQNGNVSSHKETSSSSSDSVDYIKAITIDNPIENRNNNNNNINNNGNSKDVPNLIENDLKGREETKGIVNGSSSVKETKTVPETRDKSENNKELVNGNSKSSLVEVLSNGNKSSDENASKEITKDGHYFLGLLKTQQDRLLDMAKSVEDEIDSINETNSEVPDEILGYLRAASGKSRLLVSQKMKQFADLCKSNINPVPNEKFPTTSGDLQGFWDMVNLQIDHVDSLFKDIDEMRESKWTKVVSTEKKQNSINSTVASASSTRLPRKIIPPFASTANGNNKNSATVVSKKASADLAALKREAQRRQLQELKRKHKKAKESGDQQENSSSVEIFVPSTTTTTADRPS